MKIETGRTYLMADLTEVAIDGSAGFFLKRYFNSANPAEYWYEDGRHHLQNAGKKLIMEKPGSPIVANSASGELVVRINLESMTATVSRG